MVRGNRHCHRGGHGGVVASFTAVCVETKAALIVGVGHEGCMTLKTWAPVWFFFCNRHSIEQ